MPLPEGGTVCVVGLGAAGICALKWARQLGLDATGFDASGDIGGNWCPMNDRWRPTGVWKDLSFNSSRQMSEFSDFPWKKEDFVDVPGVQANGLGDFAHSTEGIAYLKAYADKFKLRPHMRVKTRVLHVAPAPGGEGWTVTVAPTEGSGASQKEEVLHFDGVVVSVGRYCVPHQPLSAEGGSLAAFEGRVVSGAELESLEVVDGKRVLVVGSGVSGADIAAVLAARGKTAALTSSVRRVPYALRRMCDNGGICDEELFMRLNVWMGRKVPEAMSAAGFKSALLANWKRQVTKEASAAGGREGRAPAANVFEAGVTIASGYVEALEAGQFKLAPTIASSQGRTVTFQDGTQEDFDVVITATGYNVDVSFLAEEVRAQVEVRNGHSGMTEVALYKHTLHPVSHSLAFCGLYSAVGPAFPGGEMSGRYVASVFAGKTPRPSDATLRAGVARQIARRKLCTQQGDLSPELSEDLADELGITPSTLAALWNPKLYLVAPLFPAFYGRSSPDKEAAAAADQRWRQLLAQRNARLSGGAKA